MVLRYTPIKVRILPGQESRIHKGLKSNGSITIHFSTLDSSHLHSTDKSLGYLCFTPSQVAKIQKASPGTNFSFHFSSTQIKRNMQYRGGFLPLLAAFLAPILGGVIGGVAESAIAGKGLSPSKPFAKASRPLVLHKPQGTLKITSTARGLFLSPYHSQPPRIATGLYLAPHHRYGNGFRKVNNKSGMHLPSSHPCKKFIPHLRILL